ncbi:hypothetical protein [Chloroflexus sp. Y-396-1]|uniref:hypothetical protein n=1 Tax=Chloroflexus sp. Y-396-1 TaxID=867845 RepID=UPI00048D9A42|nr:hypothetical protein [Chloroflexus sp. Y-396-1]
MKRYVNSFVEYLNRYTTASPDHEAAFDEFIAGAPPPAAGPLQLTTKLERFLQQLYQRDQPPSVILTGNAGDGKTYLCRRVASIILQSNQPIDWDKLIDQPIRQNGQSLFIIKDLSELDEKKGKEVLQRLARTLREPTCRDRYLIAANEGRLRALLAEVSEPELETEIRKQLDQEHLEIDQKLLVINLTRVATSTFIFKALEWMTDSRHWRDCHHCPVQTKCPIFYNAQRIADKIVAHRIQQLYKILEETGSHITFRDMLIHLAYTISGGKRCEDIQTGIQERKDLSSLAYYENIFGRADDEGFRRKAHVIQLLDLLEIGQHSVFAIDEFIVSGGETTEEQREHQQIFSETVDVHFKYFRQIQRKYLTDNEHEQEIIRWLPHCRRKIFFESSLFHYGQLLPFRFFDQYQSLLSQPNKRHEETLRIFVKGLNRSFTRLYLNETEYLYVTARYLHSINQPHPLVLLKIPIINLSFSIIPSSYDYLDCSEVQLYLEIAPPAQVRRNVDSIRWSFGLLQFEYVLRIAMGGHPSVLSAQCELDIRRLKDRLISTFVIETANNNTSSIEFFVPNRYRYELRKLGIDEQGKITTV